MELLVAGVLLTGVVLQKRYFNVSLNACDSYSGPRSVADMFVAWAKEEDEERQRRASVPCDRMVSVWVMAVVLLIPTLTLGLVGTLSTGVRSATVLSFPLWGPLAGLFFLGMGVVMVWKFAIKPTLVFIYVVIAFPFRFTRFMTRTRGRRQQHRRSEAENTSPSPSTDAEKLDGHGASCRCSVEQAGRICCWGCGSQSCAGCSTTITPKTPRTTNHLEYCEPRCSHCYLGFLCHTKSTKERLEECSHCRLSEPTTTTAKAEGQDGQVSVCPKCAAESPEMVQSCREGRELEELKHLARSSLRCGQCKRGLGKHGPRWWACCECGRECTSAYHPAWMS
ncbi:hypothetical protein B0H66DRAFT_168236 [Apodospora peruviana]|uniref:Uncharacterized protein n=1 Tax=Apodospora peruviana TaxID=516989 RepID=A0AAE0MCJ3_9PEZI|nr:hypothetical protein B0H66DRAFT_168236 [Apodospora peruviana]